MTATEEHQVNVLVTGFGAFQEIAKNPSWEIASRLLRNDARSSPLNNNNIRVIVHPEPFRAAYHTIYDLAPKLIQTHRPDVVLHIGLAAERDYFAIERSANRDGYHQSLDVDKKVFTKAETKKSWGSKGSAEKLSTTLDLEDVLEGWREGLRLTNKESSSWKKERGKEQKRLGADMDVRLSDDVGNYVCGFVYYTSLTELAKRGDGQRAATFLHIPLLKTEEDIEKGERVVLALIGALANTWRRQQSV